MTSWDFFDTLLGRSTGREPWRLFDAVGGPEFRQLRQRAEREARDNNLEGIYRQLGEITGWPAAKVEGLRSREWDLERAAAFPIVDNVRQVAAEDVIVSDTYFSEAQVRELADRIGVPAGIRIVATWGGKHQGWVWDRVKPTRHTGDNRHGDLESARKAGIAATLYKAGEWTRDEREVLKVSPAAAGAARACRLQCPHAGRAGEIWQAQSANVAFLWLAAAAVEAYRVEHGFRRVLFASRDGLLLQRVYAALYATGSGILWTSRQTYTSPSPGFVAYVREQLEPGTLVVDLHGTGKSLAQFVERTGIQVSAALVVGLAGGGRRRQMHVPALCEAIRMEDGTRIEVINYDTGGRVLDVRDGQPVRDQVEYDADLVQVSHDAVAAAVRCAACWAAPPSARELAKAAARAAAGAPVELRKSHVPFHPVR
jgi:hypothetical protein